MPLQLAVPEQLVFLVSLVCRKWTCLFSWPVSSAQRRQHFQVLLCQFRSFAVQKPKEKKLSCFERICDCEVFVRLCFVFSLIRDVIQS